MSIKHKHRVSRPVTGSSWDEDHDVDGVLGQFLTVAELPNTLPYLTSGATGALCPLSDYMRSILVLLSSAALRAEIGAVARGGDTMQGDLSLGAHKITNLATPTTSTDAANKAYVDALATAVTGALIFKGAWDASAGTFPGGGTAKTGAFYKVSVAGTVNSKAFEVGDEIFAIVDNASTSTYAANWLKIEGGISLAEVQAAVGFTFGALASMSSITASLISDASANGRSLIMAANYAGMRTLLGLGTAALLDAGTSVGNLVQVITGGKLPALDGSNLTNLPAGGGSVTASQISDASPEGRALIMAANYAAMRTALGLGSAALLTAGTADGNAVVVQTGGKLPALDGSDLTNVGGGLPAGACAFFAMNTPPTGWLECDGSAVSRTTYASLFAALVKSSTATISIASPGVVTWTAHGRKANDPIRFTTTGALPTGLATATTYYVKTVLDANTFTLSTTAGGSAISTTGSQSGTHTAIHAPHGVGDGSTTFNLPGILGKFPRVWDHGAGVDSNRAFGSSQDDEIKAHGHSYDKLGAAVLTDLPGGFTHSVSQASASNTTGSAGGSETRPKNIALLFCVKT